MLSLRLPLDWSSCLILWTGSFLPAVSGQTELDRLPAGSLAAAPIEAPGTLAGVAGADAAPLFDCNENGVEDSIDIAVGTSSDANLNAVPDECEGPRNTVEAAEIDPRRDSPTSATIALAGGELSGRMDVHVEASPHDE